MSGFAAESEASESDETTDEDAALTELANVSKVVFSSTLQTPPQRAPPQEMSRWSGERPRRESNPRIRALQAAEVASEGHIPPHYAPFRRTAGAGEVGPLLQNCYTLGPW
jgi:hypothetical protein